jgi:hypothetical protein
MEVDFHPPLFDLLILLLKDCSPQEWAKSVGLYLNWRVIGVRHECAYTNSSYTDKQKQQDKVENVLPFLQAIASANRTEEDKKEDSVLRTIRSLQERWNALRENQRQGKNPETPAKLNVTLGNKCRKVPKKQRIARRNKYRWTFFAELAESHLIDRVSVELHPTFSPQKIPCTPENIEVTREGWGWFQVHTWVRLKPGYVFRQDRSMSRTGRIPWKLRLNETEASMKFLGTGQLDIGTGDTETIARIEFTEVPQFLRNYWPAWRRCIPAILHKTRCSYLLKLSIIDL